MTQELLISLQTSLLSDAQAFLPEIILSCAVVLLLVLRLIGARGWGQRRWGRRW